MEEALNKLKQVFDLVSREDKEKLRTELAKMVPANSETKVTTKIGWGQYEKKTHTSISLFVTTTAIANKKKDLLSIYSQIIRKISSEDKKRFIESLDVILTKKPKEIKLGNLPSMQIDDKFRAISTSFEIETI